MSEQNRDGKIESFVADMQKKIREGHFGSGRLPSIKELASTYSMSRTAVNDAIQELRASGFAYGKDGSYYAIHPPISLPLKLSGAPLFDVYLKSQGFEAVTEHIKEPEVIALPLEVARMFGQSEGVRFVHRSRVQGIPNIPMRLQETYFPADLAEQFIPAMKMNPEMNVMGEIRKVHGVAIAERRDSLVGRHPTAEEMRLLNLVRTSPVFEQRRYFTANDGRIVSFMKVTLVAAFFVLDYTSDRDGGRS